MKTLILGIVLGCLCVIHIDAQQAGRLTGSSNYFGKLYSLDTIPSKPIVYANGILVGSPQVRYSSILKPLPAGWRSDYTTRSDFTTYYRHY